MNRLNKLILTAAIYLLIFNNVTATTYKSADYHLDESKNPMGAGLCQSDMDCDGLRYCTYSGNCWGKARPDPIITQPPQQAPGSTPSTEYKAKVTELLRAKMAPLINAPPEINEIAMYLDKGADVNVPMLSGYTLLQIYVRQYVRQEFERDVDYGLQVLNFLIARGANVNAKDEWGGTPLMETAVKLENQASIAIAKFLIEKGADVNAATTDGRTALHMVAYGYNLQLAKFLIENGASIYAKDETGATPADIAKVHSSHAMVKLLTK